MKTKNEIITDVWLFTKKKIGFHFLSGMLLCITMIVAPYVGSEDLVAIGLVAFVFTVDAIIDIWFSNKTKIRKAIEIIMDANNNKKFICLAYPHIYFPSEIQDIPDELQIVLTKTQSYAAFESLAEVIPTCFISAIAFVGFGICLPAAIHPANVFWSSPNVYIAIALLIAYMYLCIINRNKLMQVWNKYFIPIYCKVDLKESLPDLFGKYDGEHTVMNLRFAIPRDGNKYGIMLQVAADFVTYIKEQYQERKEATKDIIVATPS